MTAEHPEVPPDGERDHSLLISEERQRDLLSQLVEIEHEVRRVTLDAAGNGPANRAAAEAHLAEFTELTKRACRAVRNAVTVEERIAHLDFDVDERP
ncbi:hypothetical protein AB0L88_37365 [Saccharopolyspora shandongensis]|uniref:PE family protein n=1 Tax=Saccharopolyspora shandongensis TaxID=418495 RepID=A0A1H3PF58_9PSEU|nr:hypothetical protein [Saccharopolyspora shandongensis]SDY99736.1 hypothetical protein SAMN05216215_10424 [Saccharopolyspora shandongensis]